MKPYKMRKKFHLCFTSRYRIQGLQTYSSQGDFDVGLYLKILYPKSRVRSTIYVDEKQTLVQAHTCISLYHEFIIHMQCGRGSWPANWLWKKVQSIRLSLCLTFFRFYKGSSTSSNKHTLTHMHGQVTSWIHGPLLPLIATKIFPHFHVYSYNKQI